MTKSYQIIYTKNDRQHETWAEDEATAKSIANRFRAEGYDVTVWVHRLDDQGAEPRDFDLTVEYDGYTIRMTRYPKHVNEYAGVWRAGESPLNEYLPVYETRDRLADGEVLEKIFRLIDAGII